MKEEAKWRRVDFWWWWWWCCWANECCWTGWKKNVISVNSLNVASFAHSPSRARASWMRKNVPATMSEMTRAMLEWWKRGEVEERHDRRQFANSFIFLGTVVSVIFSASLHQLLNHRRRWNNKRIFSARCKFLIFSNVSDVGDLLWSFNTQLSLISFARPCGSSSTARERYKTQEMSETKTQREIVVWRRRRLDAWGLLLAALFTPDVVVVAYYFYNKK